MADLTDRLNRFIASASVLRWTGIFAAFAVWSVGCWFLAGLLWGFGQSQPAPDVAHEGSPQVVVKQIMARELFTRPTSEPVPASAMPDNLQLLGVLFAGRSSDARVIIRREGDSRPHVLAIGEELSTGVAVGRIEPQQVTLIVGGRARVLALPQPVSRNAT